MTTGTNLVAFPNMNKGVSKYAHLQVPNEMAAGIQAGFARIGYKGKVWSITHRGDNKPLLRDDGDGPRNSIEVVIVKAASVISKNYYEGGFVDGSNERPTCYSTNGVTPDPGSTTKQHASCALCPKNKMGSKVNEQTGKKGKACSDSKRLAVVPLADIPNEAFGGPMLLRVPAGSLTDMAAYAKKMESWNYPYFTVATRISFDTAEAYPKFVFKEIRELTDEEFKLVEEMRGGHQVASLLAEASEFGNGAQDAEPAGEKQDDEPAGPAFEMKKPETVVTPKVTEKVTQSPLPPSTSVSALPSSNTPAPAATSTKTTTSAATPGATFDDELDAELDKLMGAA